MERNKTTKEILAQVTAGSSTPLFRPEILQKLEQSLATWRRENGLPEDSQITPHTVLGSQTPRELLYTPLDIPNFDYQAELGHSGQEPFTRGLHANMYRGRSFTRRQLAGFGSPEDTNQRMRFLLDHGATGLSVLFDLPTIQMYDSDDPLSAGQVGMSGVAVDSVEDMDLVFKDIDLGEVTISLVTHYPSNSAILFPMYLALAERRGIPWERLRGSIQNDITLEEVVRSGPEYIPPRACFRVQCDNIEFIRQNVANWNFQTVNGYNLREFGTSAVTEMAVAMANAIQTIEELERRGHEPEWVGRRLAFFWSIGNDFFEEAARIRAARRLWHRIMKHRFGAKDPKSTWMRCHVQTSGVSLTRAEPLNNVVRAAYHALAAVMGGAQSLHVDSYDEAYSVPTEEAALLSLRTQQILGEETAVTQVVDPLGGSYYVEALTRRLEVAILDELDNIERKGGYIATIESGWIHKHIADYFQSERARQEDGRTAVVGENLYPSTGNQPEISVFRYPEGVEENQCRRLAVLRENRDASQVEAALTALESDCKDGRNLVSASVQCARVGCSGGEIWKVFKSAFGTWRPPSLG